MANYGSAFNMLYANTAASEIAVGMGATELMWSDRHAATIVAVRHFKSGARKGQVKEVDVQRDTATRADQNGMSDAQSYDYEPDPNGSISTYRADAKGRFRRVEASGFNIVQDAEGRYIHVPYGPYRIGTQGLLVGTRREYHDYGF